MPKSDDRAGRAGVAPSLAPELHACAVCEDMGAGHISDGATLALATMTAHGLCWLQREQERRARRLEELRRKAFGPV